MQSTEQAKPEEKLYMGRICWHAESLSLSKTKDLCEVILKANVIMRSRVRERRTHGSVRGLRREPLVYSTKLPGTVSEQKKEQQPHT